MDDLSVIQKERYTRQILMPEINIEGQKRLRAARVLIVGAGGLGSPAAFYLTAAGVGELGIMDKDVVDLSNLQRQILHNEARMGQNKAQSAAETLLPLNNELKLSIYPFALTRENATDIFIDYDVILDAVDDYATKLLISDTCVQMHKVFCHAGVIGFSGQVMIHLPHEGPCLRCLFSDIDMNSFPHPTPVLGTTVGVVGSVLAQETIKYLVGMRDGIIGKLWCYDGITMQTRIIPLGRNKNCPVCGDKKVG